MKFSNILQISTLLTISETNFKGILFPDFMFTPSKYSYVRGTLLLVSAQSMKDLFMIKKLIPFGYLLINLNLKSGEIMPLIFVSKIVKMKVLTLFIHNFSFVKMIPSALDIFWEFKHDEWWPNLMNFRGKIEWKKIEKTKKLKIRFSDGVHHFDSCWILLLLLKPVVFYS